MAKSGTITFTGASGQTYAFDIYPWGTSFKAFAAVYAVTKRYQNSEGGYTHTVLYFGQTSDLSERFDDHHKADCLKRNGANCICIHLEESEATRIRIEKDLIPNYNPSCNN